jgi:hypothetical protein
VKLDSLIATRRELQSGYVAEFILGSLLGYEVSEQFGIGVRAWATAAYSDKFRAVGVAEPQLRWHFGSVGVVIGGLIPFAGALTDPMFGAFRVAFDARL